MLHAICFNWNINTPTKKNQETTAAALEQSKKEYAEVIQSKDLSLQELNRVKNQQAEELECIQSTIQELKTSLALEKERYIKLLQSQCFLDKVQCFLMFLFLLFWRAKELEDKLIENNTELERRNTVLGKSHQITCIDIFRWCGLKLKEIFYSTGETINQATKKDGLIQILKEELVRFIWRESVWFLSKTSPCMPKSVTYLQNNMCSCY